MTTFALAKVTLYMHKLHRSQTTGPVAGPNAFPFVLPEDGLTEDEH